MPPSTVTRAPDPLDEKLTERAFVKTCWRLARLLEEQGLTPSELTHRGRTIAHLVDCSPDDYRIALDLARMHGSAYFEQILCGGEAGNGWSADTGAWIVRPEEEV